MIAGGCGRGYAIAKKLAMNEKRGLILVLLGAMQLAALLPVGFLGLDWFRVEWLQAITTGAFFGSGFAAVSVAGTWAALGPFPVAMRLPCALCWTVMAGILAMFNIHMASGGDRDAAMEGLVLAAAFLILWLIVQTPLWIARSVYRFKLELPRPTTAASTLSEHQFGIRQLLIVTAVIAAALGAGRLLVLGIGSNSISGQARGPDSEFLVIIALLLISNSLVAFIVVTGALLPKRSGLAVALGIAVVGGISLVESAVMTLLPGGPPGFFQMFVFIGTMNGIQFGWLLASLLLLRAAGYRLIAAR